MPLDFDASHGHKHFILYDDALRCSLDMRRHFRAGSLRLYALSHLIRHLLIYRQVEPNICQNFLAPHFEA